MPSKTKALQAAARASKQAAVEPKPPQDLWERMAELNERHGFHAPIKQPPGTLTSDEYAKMYGISITPAKQRLKFLVEHGEMEIVGIGLNRQRFYRPK